MYLTDGERIVWSIIIITVMAVCTALAIWYHKRQEKIKKEKATENINHLLEAKVDEGGNGFITLDGQYVQRYELNHKTMYIAFPLNEIVYVMTIFDNQSEFVDIPWMVRICNQAKLPLRGTQYFQDIAEPVVGHSGEINMSYEQLDEVWDLIRRNNAKAVRVDENFKEITEA